MARKPFDPNRVKVPADEQLLTAPDKPMSVSAVTAMIKQALAKLPPKLAVEGEISNFTRSQNGHLYFTLKDEAACIDCVIWRSDAARLKFSPADGLAVTAIGQVDVYEPRGRYQLYVSRLLPRGQGELELAFRQLHEKLSRLGWFDPARKRPIPRIPRTIGVVTSRTGAAIRDVLRTLAIRWPIARVIVADARVQGEGAIESVVAAISRLNRHAAAIGGVDVLIVARGGGSLEDLWAFNTEPVAKAIRESRIPVVAGIGHEVDTTIADLVADYRAATPTAAAQAVVPDRREIIAQLSSASSLLFGAVHKGLAALRHELDSAVRSPMFRKPASMIQTHRQRLDELSSRLASGHRDLLHGLNREVADLAQRLQWRHPRAMLIERWRHVESRAGRMRWALGRLSLRLERTLGDLAARLRSQEPGVRVNALADRLSTVAKGLDDSTRRFLVGRLGRVEAITRQLAAFDPRAVLRRGYSITTIAATGGLLTRAEQVVPGQRLTTELSDGRVTSDVVDSAGEPARPRSGEPARPRSGEPARPRAGRKPRKQSDDSAQPRLFDNGADDGKGEHE